MSKFVDRGFHKCGMYSVLNTCADWAVGKLEKITSQMASPGDGFVDQILCKWN